MAGNNHSIFLVGFMGSGKTTVAKILAGLLDLPVVDLDELIVKRSRRTIATIFQNQGEDEFRQLETEVLADLPQDSAAVIATGGGVVIREINWQLMQQRGIVVYLRTQWEQLQTRLQGSNDRPLANSDQGWEPVRKLLTDRLPLYERASVIIDTDELSPRVIAELIASTIKTRKN